MPERRTALATETTENTENDDGNYGKRLNAKAQGRKGAENGDGALAPATAIQSRLASESLSSFASLGCSLFCACSAHTDCLRFADVSFIDKSDNVEHGDGFFDLLQLSWVTLDSIVSAFECL